MKYTDALNYINSLLRFGIRPGLGRISLLLQQLGNPQDELKCIHVAGTNGKGSVCNMLSSVLTRAGYKTGLFTSPFVVDFRERFQIDGQMIPKRELASLLSQIIPHIDQNDSASCPTEFELITALAFLYFKKNNCDLVVLETGLGGRFDSTNVISSPLASVITSISFDHTAVLGNTLEEIAFEKSGIIKEGCPVVCYPRQRQEVLRVIQKTTEEKHNRFYMPDEAKLQIHSCDIFGNRFAYKNWNLHVPMSGEHQVYNAVTALETLSVIESQGYKIPGEAVEKGMAAVRVPSRCEILSVDPVVLLDGAHNADGARVLAQTIAMLEEKPVLILGMMKDKDVEAALQSLAPMASEIITVPVQNLRAMTPQELAEQAKRYNESVTAEKSIHGALRRALGCHKPVVIAGSLYLASEIRNKI